MKATERDELLIRLDERTETIEKTTDKQEKHLVQLNEKVNSNVLNIDRNHNRIKDVEETMSQGLSIKLSGKQKATGSAGIVTLLVLLVTALGKSLGWW